MKDIDDEIQDLEVKLEDIESAWDYLDSSANNLKDYFKEEYKTIVDIMHDLENEIDSLEEELEELYEVAEERNRQETNQMNYEFERSRL